MGLTEKQKQQIKGVSLNMWQCFINAVNEELPEAAIVHDKFHVIIFFVYSY